MIKSTKVLVVDDERTTREALAQMVSDWGPRVEVAASGAEALHRSIELRPDIIITDLIMPDLGGIELMQRLRGELPDCQVVIVTGQASVDAAVEAIRRGAYDFIEKPLEPQRLRLLLDRAAERLATVREVQVLRRSLRQMGPGAQFIGQSAAMRQVFSLIERVAPSKAAVVITGHSGTGKEMVARAIHELSPRRERPFLPVNCSAIPATLMESEFFGFEKGSFTGAEQRRPGCFELADKGTLFLDEIGELPLELQGKLLRVLEEERLRRLGGKVEVEVDVRVLCATHRDLKEEIRAGRFREDLYFRLNVFQIQLAPLKDRPEDVPALVDHFLARFARDLGKKLRGVSPEAMGLLKAYAWPGNIRELRNALERAAILVDGELIGREHLPPEVVGPSEQAEVVRLPLGRTLAEVEKAYILGSLARLGGNRSKTALALGISEKTLYNRLKEYRLEEFQSSPQLETGGGANAGEAPESGRVGTGDLNQSVS